MIVDLYSVEDLKALISDCEEMQKEPDVSIDIKIAAHNLLMSSSALASVLIADRTKRIN